MRHLRGLSQQDLAERAGLSENAVSSFERGERFPRASTLDALAEALQTEADVFIGDVLAAREEHAGDYADDGDVGALRELVDLLQHEPEDNLRLVLDLARTVLPHLPGPELPQPHVAAPAQRNGSDA